MSQCLQDLHVNHNIFLHGNMQTPMYTCTTIPNQIRKMIKTGNTTGNANKLLQREITGHYWEVLEERYLACFLMPCVCHELYCLPLSALPPQQLESGAERGPQKAPSAFAAAKRYWVRLALATAAFLFPWPVSQTCSGLPRVQPIEASILTRALEHRLERVAKTDWQRLRILPQPERRRPAPLRQPYTSTYQSNRQPKSTDASTDHLPIPGSVDTWSSERDEGLK